MENKSSNEAILGRNEVVHSEHEHSEHRESDDLVKKKLIKWLKIG
jgi:hypothetical protein